MKNTKTLPEIKVGHFRPVKYYEADITGPDEYIAQITDLGRKVATNDQLFNIGINYVITNAVNGQFELTSVGEKKKRRK
ncbi:MAG: hypothetical protein EBU90_18740 [Proteobacteria bacterium]|nr:hypothetical protein [Pseudomonadota bacterium]NBP16680.1 hypothetical protein [bacterium]